MKIPKKNDEGYLLISRKIKQIRVDAKVLYFLLSKVLLLLKKVNIRHPSRLNVEKLHCNAMLKA